MSKFDITDAYIQALMEEKAKSQYDKNQFIVIDNIKDDLVQYHYETENGKDGPYESELNNNEFKDEDGYIWNLNTDFNYSKKNRLNKKISKKEEDGSIIVTQDIDSQEQAQELVNDRVYFKKGEKVHVKDWNGNEYDVIKENKRFIEAKKYNSPVFHIYDVDDNKFEFKCLYYEVTNSNQASLWGHEVELRHNEKLVSNAKISYYNRTWETFEFQSCMLEALRNYMASVANNIYSTYKETNNTNRISTNQKTKLLNQDETYKTLQKLYDLISSGNKGELTESYNQDKIKKESISTDGNIAETFENYPAFKANFDDIIIKKSPYDKQYYIFKKDAESESDYIYYAKNKDIIEGWLYGAVMAKNNRM